MLKKRKNGFTIVELLIVIVVIAILAAISVVAYNGIQARAADARREQDMSMIVKALRSYEAIHGGVPITTAYSGSGTGGWNNTLSVNWLSFLETDFGKMPRDSVNILDTSNGYPDDANERAYFYYCYPSSSVVEPNKPTVRMGYRSEQTGTMVRRDFIVQSCLTELPS